MKLALNPEKHCAVSILRSRRKGNVRCRSREALWRQHESTESGTSAQSRTLSRGFRLSINSQRIRSFEVTICDRTSERASSARYRPYAFTEQGVAMLSSVLRSRRAAEVNIAIMRTFVQLRRLMDTNRDLARKVEALEKKYDEQFADVFAVIKELVAPEATPRKQIGFHP
jgi:hypothetical protein